VSRLSGLWWLGEKPDAPNRRLPRTASRFLLEEIYVEERVDSLKMATIELAKRHTYANLKEGDEATVLFYTPPETTYEVRVRAYCYEEGLYFQFVNGVHDVFHGRRERWDTPVYIFEIIEIYDNHPAKMGEKVYP